MSDTKRLSKSGNISIGSGLLSYELDSDYELKLTAWGGGRLEDDKGKLEEFLGRVEAKRSFPQDISLFIEDTLKCKLDYGYTEIDTAFLLQLRTLRELILPDSVTHIDMTPELEALLKKNDTLIRGSFDSFAENFASEQGLHFRPSDTVISHFYFEPAQETTVKSIVIARDGSMQVEEEVSSPGSSAGNTFGGTFHHDLPRNFYKTMTNEQIAERFPFISASVIEDGRFTDFVEKLRTHKVYMEEN
ncbi:MAG: hypothetical protein IKO47_10885 [Ruminococcus sp.]|nr:hypothetical protein [Ruminococcus sp.]